jgi:hypothetical protein
VADPLAALRPLRNLPSAVVVLHRGRDEESTRGKMIQYSAIFNGASIVVVNLVQPGDSWQGVSTKGDVGKMVKQFLEAVE